MRKLLLISAVFAAAHSNAQTPEDALRYGYPLMSGTARNQAIGGAMGSLGGDISATYVNPAGLGMYRTSEFVISPGFNFVNNKFSYRGTNDQKGSDNSFAYGTTGFVFGFGRDKRQGSKPKSSAISISINQLANYNNHVEYKGLNNQSSWSEQYLEELTRDRVTSVNAAENNYIFGSSLAYWTFLVDTISGPGGQVLGYQSLVPISTGVMQHNTIDTRGGAHEISIGFGHGDNDKLYLGGSLNIPVYSFSKDQTYREDDATTNTNNDFSYFEYKERYRSTGAGFNVKLGMIYKPVERFRLGLAIHSPTFGSFTDRISSSITANTENYTIYSQPITKTSDELKGEGNTAGTYNYQLTTPWKGLVSASYVFNEIHDVTKQKAFITADLEYVTNGTTKYSVTDGGTTDDENYYKQLNQIIKDRYKGAVNVRVGGEMKFNTWMVRAGFAHYGNAYREEALKNSRTLLSGGLGYRNHGMFIDLTYVHAFLSDISQPYVLMDKPNTFAESKNNRGNIVATVGFKF